LTCQSHPLPEPRYCSGVNATADSTNKFAVASGAVLFNHIGADMQMKVNKNAAGNKASFLFPNGIFRTCGVRPAGG